MSAARVALQALQRIPYALAGLVAGNCILGLVSLVLDAREGGHPALHFSELIRGVLVTALLSLLLSLPGWLLLGLPFTLFVPSRLAKRIHPLIALLIGSVIGPLSLAIIFARMALAGGQFTSIAEMLPDSNTKFDRSMASPFLYPAVVGASAIYIYTVLLRHYDGSSRGPATKPGESKATVSPRADV